MNQIAKREDPKPELKQGGSLLAIVPQDAEQAFRMAGLIIKAGWAPKDMNRPEAVTVAIMKGLEVGMKPMQAVQSIAIINGRPCIWGDAAIGLVAGSGLLTGKREWVEGEGDNMVARCELHRLGWDGMPIEASFSVKDARDAGLWGKGGPWKQYPKRMLQLRARAFALRDGFADVLTGLQLREEVRDYQTTERAVEDAPKVSGDDLLRQGGFEPDADVIDADDANDFPEGPSALETAAVVDERIKVANADTIEALEDDVSMVCDWLTKEDHGDQAKALRKRYDARRQALTEADTDGELLI